MARKVKGVAGIDGDGPKRFEIGDHLDLERAARDAEILAAKLRENPEGITEVFHAVRRGDKKAAAAKLQELGMSEDDFKEQGGGLFWLVVLVVVLYATDAY